MSKHTVEAPRVLPPYPTTCTPHIGVQTCRAATGSDEGVGRRRFTGRNGFGTQKCKRALIVHPGINRSSALGRRQTTDWQKYFTLTPCNQHGLFTFFRKTCFRNFFIVICLCVDLELSAKPSAKPFSRYRWINIRGGVSVANAPGLEINS